MTLEQLLAKLITFETVTGNREENRRALDWVGKTLSPLPLHAERFSSGGFDSLLLTTRKTKEPYAWLVAHMDVVPAPRALFSPKATKRYLRGRGAYDMKFAIACYMKLLRDLGEGLPGVSIGVMLTTDEEVGGQNGVGKLVEKGYRSNVAFVPDGGRDWSLEHAAKGAWHVRVESRGVASHGSRPWYGKNAIIELSHFLSQMSAFFDREPCGNPTHSHRTFNVGTMNGGSATNQTADYAEAQVDIRFCSAEDKKELEKRMRALQKYFSGISVKTVLAADNFNSPTDDAHAALWRSISQKRFKIKKDDVLSHGSSDARYFAERGIPTLITRPRGSDDPSEAEHIDLADLGRFYAVLREFVEETSTSAR